jgi:hypothetical protein
MKMDSLQQPNVVGSQSRIREGSPDTIITDDKAQKALIYAL